MPSGSFFDFIILPILILLARIIDVSMDTIRVIMIAKGLRKLAPLIGFFQSLIWIVTITRIMVNLENWITYFGYAAGFAAGTYVGMVIEGKLALGYEFIRIITRMDATRLVQALREAGYPVTSVKAMGREGEVGILYLIFRRKNLKRIVDIIKRFNANAFYTIEDIRFVSRPHYLPATQTMSGQIDQVG